jgi:RNA 2',3'-cyclic 3'-phosphodiesterase
MPPVRTFIAFATPPDIRSGMLALQSELKKANADVKWESPDKFHATIKFLGDVAEGMLPNMLNKIRVAAEATAPFEVSYQTLGCFPNKKNPRVIWIGCHNADGTLDFLKTRLDVDLLPLDFEIEERAFHPHITLGRVRSQRGLNNLTPMLEKLTFDPRNALVKEIVVMKSVLKRDGSEYSILQTTNLRTAR